MTDEKNWLETLASIVDSLNRIKPFKELILSFFRKLGVLFRGKEKESVDLMDEYLQVVQRELKNLETAGMSRRDILELAKQLKLPVIQANRDALLLKIEAMNRQKGE